MKDHNLRVENGIFFREKDEEDDGSSKGGCGSFERMKLEALEFL